MIPGVDGFMYPNEVELQWSVLIVLYPFVTGLVAGAFILASLERVFKVEAVRPTYRLALLTALAFLLVARLLSRKAPRDQERIYRSYAFSPQLLRASDIARRKRGRKVISSANGQIYDLEKIFAKLNRRYFDGEIEKPVLTWSQRRARSILGHHDAAHETITISKILDSREVPEWFVEYILFHEMLHIKHPARIVNGRRYYHTNAFRAEEQSFPRYQHAQEWLDHVVRKRQELRARAA